MSLRSPDSRSGAYTVSPHPQTGASTGTCALLSALPRQSVAFYGLDAKMVEAEGLARAHRARPSGLRLRRPGRAAALPHMHLRFDSRALALRVGLRPIHLRCASSETVVLLLDDPAMAEG